MHCQMVAPEASTRCTSICQMVSPEASTRCTSICQMVAPEASTRCTSICQNVSHVIVVGVYSFRICASFDPVYHSVPLAGPCVSTRVCHWQPMPSALGSYCRHFYSDSKAMTQREQFLTVPNRNILTYLLITLHKKCHNRKDPETWHP